MTAPLTDPALSALSAHARDESGYSTQRAHLAASPSPWRRDPVCRPERGTLTWACALTCTAEPGL